MKCEYTHAAFSDFVLQMSPGPLSSQCVEAMLRNSRIIQLSWRQMRQKFITFDKERTGKISFQDFRKVQSTVLYFNNTSSSCLVFSHATFFMICLGSETIQRESVRGGILSFHFFF